ncbi:MAG TPA: 4-(cytidine 5'-diphospho)-2-C-methyl-D-erythritol kinase [Nitrosomonas sp.]|nr:4-(cytidine 5'-diphospho)-2-C-methyl-D-erythritol kinase [Nitrosomonas sp.]HMW19887.1 4-(cytidine 5'-diphospho)-2-C-methyl-D-erythritol kinase [Nitrosomonas sp.]HMW68718.1 4-(cytidine 5'-diphospho)-2-C-methyl-D-erythritol kinase [Nitrosomonas sp.]HMY60848.1 4-(cytidine 5'-diphospho)-2-C-methyl-D-erythritol kinase [Nitrosomonas sp.]HMY89215.1 4-(cytidine 5'-diphospho)-2-C-methyl-D-erythritol kinase [Nitrosomonas sp.]
MQFYPAPAKLNLFLHIIGRRDDGYHLLQTIFRFIDLNDRLGFNLRNDGVIQLQTPLAGVAAEQNLCIRAAKLLQEEGSVNQGVDIYLEKHIAMGGGLGGGSSDAATTLIMLNSLWGLNWHRDRLMELGLKLGADVPVFIYGDNAFAEGVGEKLSAVNLPNAWYLVLMPPVHVSTAQIFASNELTRNTIPITIPPFSIRDGHNDLEPVVCRMYSDVAKCIDWLKKLDNTTLVAMTGSGSSVFAEFETEAQAKEAYLRLPDGVNAVVAKGLTKHPLKDFYR